jgi:6-phosphofructokinase 1
MGAAAIDALLDDQKSIMVGLVNNEIVHVPLSKSIKLHKDVNADLLKLADVIR